MGGGEREIRTPEGLITLDGFQDRCIQPLCHLSKIVEATPGFEPGMGALQAPALPLGHASLRTPYIILHMLACQVVPLCKFYEVTFS